MDKPTSKKSLPPEYKHIISGMTPEEYRNAIENRPINMNRVKPVFDKMLAVMKEIVNEPGIQHEAGNDIYFRMIQTIKEAEELGL